MENKNTHYNENHIHWFRNDLRLDDQPFVVHLSHCKNLMAVYVLDPRHFEYTEIGVRKISLRRLQFLRESLCDLQFRLRDLGSDLKVIFGKPEFVLVELQKSNNSSISFQKEYAVEESEVEKAIYQNIDSQYIKSYENGFLVHPSLLPFELEKLPMGFTSFRNKLEKKLDFQEFFTIELPLSLPPNNLVCKKLKESKRVQNSKSALPFLGGEIAAKKRLNYYLFESKKIKKYKKTRNGLLGPDYSSKFSAFLANGNLSANFIMAEIRKFECEHGSNDGTYWLFFELLWRDFFRYQAKKFGQKIFFFTGILNKKIQSRKNYKAFESWTFGLTQNKFVDANMIELSTTGFMSNRGRQNIASYLIHDLGIDWRWGAAWFEHHLLDYDVYSNQGNWMYIAGIGNDPQGGRKFDIDWQAKNYDPNEEFVNLWLKY